MTRDQQVQFIRDAVRHAMRVTKAGETRKIGRTGDVASATQPEPITCRNQGAAAASFLAGKAGGPITSAVGAAVRNDRVNEVSRVDTNKRLHIDLDVAEAAGCLPTRYPYPVPSREDIQKEAGRNATDTDAIRAVMRIQRKLNGTE